MDTVFSLQWPEYVMAMKLQKYFKKSEGYSVLIPASREEKGIDLALLKKQMGKHITATFQVKASRTYIGEKPKKETTQRFRYYTWFNAFEVPDEADFFMLFGSYAPDISQTKKTSPMWYEECTLLLTHKEMKKFIKNCLQVSGKPDKQFGFGFDDKSRVIQTRGDMERRNIDYTEYLLENRIEKIKKIFA